ncbi:MAG TPA: amino acid permease [Candidatus Eisenbacteria bacterium]|nr:amino acid permease [Candidatus Eisenbacteria bacterium]
MTTTLDKSTGSLSSSQTVAVLMAVESANQLRRILGMRDLVLMILGTVIGSGIFLVPGAVLQAVGNSVPVALTVWLAGGLLSLLGALTYGELSAMKPQAGGLYIYIRDCFGAFPAFLFGWTMFFVIGSGSIATLAVAFGNYLGEFIQLSALQVKIVAVLMIAVIAVVNVLGTRKSANLLNLTTAVKVGAILAFGTVLLWRGTHSVFGEANPVTRHSSGLVGFGLAMISVLWAYEGWQYVTYTAGETLNPQRVFPRAFFIGTAALIAIYVFANLGYLAALGTSRVAESTRVAASALGVVLGHGAGKLVALAILISMFSAANAVILNAPRVYYAMARDGLFFASLSRVHPRFGTPVLAICAAAIWSAALAASGTYEQLLTYVVFIGWIFYALAAASIFIYRKRSPDVLRPYRVPGYPVTPAVFIVAALALVANTIATQPMRAAVGLGIVLLGAPVYMFWRHSIANTRGGNLFENV